MLNRKSTGTKEPGAPVRKGAGRVKEAEARLKILIWCKRMEKLLEKNENTYASERWRLIQNAGNHLEQPSGNAAPDGDRLRDHDGAGHRAVD